MKGKGQKMESFDEEEEEHIQEVQMKVEDQPGTSAQAEKGPSALELLEDELHQPQLNVQEIGRIITDGMLEKELNDEILKDFSKKIARNIQAIPNINIWNLADDLNRGTIDSRLAVIGNAFLWNLLKTSMSSVREKLDHYHFKMTTLSTGFSAAEKAELVSSRAGDGEFYVMPDSIFQKTDLLDVYNHVVFRKNGDMLSKSKQFIKAYMIGATNPRCAIWHYSLRQSGTSHKKLLQDFPTHVLDAILHFLLTLAGLGAPELELDSHEKISAGNGFFFSLGNTKDECIVQFEQLKSMRESLIAKFRQSICDALNECREMPYNTLTLELMPPPRGKPIDTSHCVTWRVYESLLKRCEMHPSKENIEAKRDIEYKLCLAYHPRDEEDDEVVIDK